MMDVRDFADAEIVRYVSQYQTAYDFARSFEDKQRLAHYITLLKLEQARRHKLRELGRMAPAAEGDGELDR